MPLQRGRGWDTEGPVEATTRDPLDLDANVHFFFLLKAFVSALKMDILHLQSSRSLGRHTGAMPTGQRRSRWFKPSPNNRETQTVLVRSLQPVHRVSFFRPQ